MFAKTSESQQRRKTISRADATENVNGVDLDVWKEGDVEDERRQIVFQLKDLELKLSKIRAQLADATQRYNSPIKGRIIPRDLFNRWTTQKIDTVARIHSLEAKLSLIKRDKIVNSSNRQESFESAFALMAKQMLAGPVYDRILIAAVHRIGGEPPRRLVNGG